jgi:ATP-dependent Lon protease
VAAGEAGTAQPAAPQTGGRRKARSASKQDGAHAAPSGAKARFVVLADELPELLGSQPLPDEVAGDRDEIGVVTGMAATSVGGDILFIEAAAIPGKGQFTLTGKLGDVMQESARAALTYTRRRAPDFNVPVKFFEQHDLHVHVPAGAIPKDGPSAGVTMATALVSAVTRRPVRKDVSMTGEISLRGKVLPVGGIKEKVLAAHRAGIRTIVLPKDNARDLEDVPADLRDDITFVFAEHVDDVLNTALLPNPKPEEDRLRPELKRGRNGRAPASQATAGRADSAARKSTDDAPARKRAARPAQARER